MQKRSGDAIGAHGAPLIVVALQPGLGEVAELLVFGDPLRREMAVVVEDGLGLGVVVEEADGGGGFEEEVVVDERVCHDLIF